MFPSSSPRHNLLLRTKLVPPRVHSRVLARPGLHALLCESLSHRVTIVHAGTGYSKTTALASLDTGQLLLFWYSLSETDTDPQRFLSYLISAFSVRLPELSDMPLAVLQERGSESSMDTWEMALNALINTLSESLAEPSLLVLDDYHFVSDSSEINSLTEHLIANLPPMLHVIISTRYMPPIGRLVAWRARGEALDIGRAALSFSREEIQALFCDVYGMPLGPEECAALLERTEGWPIALQLAWQGLRSNAGRSASALLERGSTSLSALFDYLAAEVLNAQSDEVAAFLSSTSILRELTPAACDALTGRIDSAAMLDQLLDLDLFMVALGDRAGRHYRYHHLFHDFLRQRESAEPASTHLLHERAAEYFAAAGDYEDAIYHWLTAGDLERVAATIERAGDAALRTGWLDTVSTWIDVLPPSVLQAHPLLQAYLGDIYRMRSRFSEALGWYRQAESVWRARNDPAGVSRALRGQALVYLDTVRPAQAESLLEEALRLVEGLEDLESRARLLELLAENKLNMGKPAEAESLRGEAQALRDAGPGEDALSVRVKLRTGRLDEAQRILERWVETERQEAAQGQVHPPRSHRETLLILSLIHSLRGSKEKAFQLAQEGIALGSVLNSPFVTAVGHVRLGHAWQLGDVSGMDEAIACYNRGVALGDQLAVTRMRAEAMWGLTRAYGYSGDLASAEKTAEEGVRIGRAAGDAWIVALIELALGSSYVLEAQSEKAVELLSKVVVSFRECGDNFGRAAARAWLALAYKAQGQADLCSVCIEDALTLCETHGYGFLFTSPSLLGPPEVRRMVPLLLGAKENRRTRAYVCRLLADLGLPDIHSHPGYRLRVYALGAFRVSRGVAEIEPRDWQRDKARQLFQLLLTQRGRWLQRDEIVECLWPSLSPEVALRDFKVALSALNRALEPAHAPDAVFAFIVRDGGSYRLRPEADLWFDAAEFEAECGLGMRLAEQGARDEALKHLQNALDLYRGNYLPDALYEDWASSERERLLSLFLRAADRLAGMLVESGGYAQVLEICGRILASDPCWERAYRWQMLAYARQGDRTLALRVFQRCASTLQAELGVEPAPATVALYKSILQSGDLIKGNQG